MSEKDQQLQLSQKEVVEVVKEHTKLSKDLAAKNVEV